MIRKLYYLKRKLNFLLIVLGLLGVGITFAQEDSLQYEFKESSDGGLFLDDQIEYAVTYLPESKQYLLQAMIGDVKIGEPVYMTQGEYLDLVLEGQIKTVYREKSREYDQQYRDRRAGIDGEYDNIIPSLEVSSPVFEAIFGGNKIELIPNGSASFDLGALIQQIDNPQLLPQNRNTFTLDLQQRIQVGLLGKVGENLNLNLNYDTQAGFAFENRLNLNWRPNTKGGEDNIIQNIEFGNISMPLNTSLIQGAQALFGVRTDLKFGRTNVSAVFSQQQSETRNIVAQGDELVNTYKIFAENYEYNKHFFLGQYFRNQYNNALENYPLINSTANIQRIEVWRIDRAAGSQQERRSIVAVRDVGELGIIRDADGQIIDVTNAPNNQGSDYDQVFNLLTNGTERVDVSTARELMPTLVDAEGNPFQDGENYVINENARKLDPSEYTYYPQLGYISLNQPIIDGEDLLAVSIQYTDNGEVKKIGEVSDEEDGLLIVKLLKPNNAVDTSSDMWDLMMKNVYTLNAFNLSQEDFIMNVLFKDFGEEASGTVNYLPNTNIENQTLIQTMGVDRLDQNGNAQVINGIPGDGIFDFLPGITVNQQQGTITFTQVEPFGSDLEAQLAPEFVDDFVFNEMYEQLPGQVLGETLSQRYSLEGRYKGETGSGIPLGAFNVPQGSVTVTANGQELIEGVDYTVDYQLGRVNVINQQLVDSGVPINISLENQSTFNLQRKRFMGLNVEHRYSDNFIVGGTLLNYQERPLTQKALYGSEPVNNTIVGVNGQYNGQSEKLTRWINKIPGIKTDTPSQINFAAEAAYLIPGTNNAVNGESYIDDFEDSQTQISLLDQFAWRLGSTPGTPAGYTDATTNNANPLFPNGVQNNDLSYNNGRRLMSWYTIDPRFYGLSGGGGNVSEDGLSNHRSRRVLINELFDQRDVLAGNINFLSTLDLTFYPQERGPYNVNPSSTDTENWGAITRAVSVTNFTDANIEYIEFWLMDPYRDNTGGDGNLIFQIGNISEDVLKDGELQYESGLPTEGETDVNTSLSNWGVQPENYPVVYAFDTDGAARTQQDLGYDGLDNTDEALQFSNTTGLLNPITGEVDPAADDYLFYLDSRWDALSIGNSVTNRYRYFNNSQNNSPAGSLDAATQVPDAEDVNTDYNLDQTEFYAQYRVPLNRNGDRLDQSNQITDRFIVATKDVDVTFENGTTGSTTWYQFRIPVDEFDNDLNQDGVADANLNLDRVESVLTSARFMRVVMQGFQEETTLRFGTLDLVRSDWRRYTNNIFPENGEEGTQDSPISNTEIGVVDIEQNSTSQPPYVLPPGIEREQLQGTTGFQAQNEASMVIQAELDGNRGNNNATGVFRNVNLDLRRYKRLEMFVHAEDLINRQNNELDSDAKLFIRMGSDYSDNYYEYELSLKYTPQSATSVADIWPNENIIDILTDIFVNSKIARDEEGFSTIERYAVQLQEGTTDRTVYIKGRPSLGNITSLMIGLRNVGSDAKNIRTWVNELRLSEIDNEGGYAATATLGLTLGDFAQINATGNYKSVGFGAIDVGPSLRSQEEIINYTINTQVKLDKFLPESWGLELPLTYNFSEEFIDPKFNPLDTDVEFDQAPNRDELQDIVRTYSKQQTVGFSNIRKIRKSGKPARFYSLSNFNLSFLYSDFYYRDIYTTYNVRKNLRGAINYSYSFKNKFKQPFKDWRMVQDTAQSAKYLQWIKEFNFNPLPSRISFRTDVVRTYNEQQFRDINSFLGGGSGVQFQPTYSSNFLLSWQYNVGFDLTRSLKIDYTSATRTLNDEPEFLRLDRGLIWKNLTSVGRPVNYDQSLRVNWRTPLNLLPYLFWTNAEVGFTSNYNWQASSTVLTTIEDDLGNTAQNANSWNVIGNLDFNALYRTIPAFQKLDSIRQGRKRELDSLNTVYDKQANSKSKRKRKSKKYKFKHRYKFKDYFLLFAQSIKQAQTNYTQTNGAVLPGLLGEPNFFGVGSGNGQGSGAPGLGFVFGTEFDIKDRAIREGWVSTSELLLTPFQLTKNTDFNYNVQIEPANKFRIDINGARSSTFRSLQSNFNQVDVLPDIAGNQASFIDELETLNVSLITAGTAFTDPDQFYDDFINNAQIISERLGSTNPSSTGLDPDTNYYDGYGIANADVLVPAFLATLQGTDASGSKLGYKRNFPLPNWRMSYAGLIDIPWFKKRFNSIELTHSYVSSYTAAGVQSNINFYSAQVNPDFGTGDGRDINGNFYTDKIYGSINVAEAFAPLIGIDMTFRNNLQLRAQYNRDRIISLSLANYTLNEDYGNEFVAGLGYVFKDLKLKMRYRGRKKTIKGDLNVRADLRMRDSETRLRRLIEDDSQIIGGQQIFSLRINADYDLSKNFNLRFFYEHDATEYKISTAFPITTIRTGISATFTFN